MKYLVTSLILIGLLFPTGLAYAQVKKEKPNYASSETEQIITNMIEAHGGWDTWSNASSISYDNVFYNTFAPAGQNPWWVNYEIIEQMGSSRNDQRVFQRFDLGGPKGGFTMARNGEEVWASSNWAIGNYPKFMSYFFYYFLNLPWLTQDDIVQLSAPETADYKNEKVYKIKMTFSEKPAIGKTKRDWFTLYIDQESHRLVAYEYAMTYGAQMDIMGMPASAEFIGPVLRHIDEFVEVDGLLFPARMHTTDLGESQVYGHHALINYSITKAFDNALVVKPSDGVTDTSSDHRASN